MEMTAPPSPAVDDAENPSTQNHPEWRDGRRFKLGFFTTGLMWTLPWATAIQVLLPQRFTDIGVSDPVSLVAQINAVGAVVALVANLFFGALSDRSRSRWGRRTPFMVAGGVVAGVFLVLAYLFTSPLLIIVAWSGFQVGLNALLAPFLATLSDRVPESNRATTSALYGIGVSIGVTLGATVGAVFLKNPGIGFLIGAVIVAASGVVTAIIWPTEGSAEDRPAAEAVNVMDIVRSFTPPTRNARDFYLALLGRLLIMLAYYMPAGFTLYILKDYLGLTTEQAQTVIPLISIPTVLASILASAFAGTISDRWGRRKPLVILCAVLVAVGFVIPWLHPTVPAMIASGVIGGLALGLYNTAGQALNVDVLPDPEQAGKDLGVLNLSNTFGQILGPVIAATVYGAMGSYRPVYLIGAIVALSSIPVIALIRKAR